MVGLGGSSAGSYLADPTSPIPSHYAVIILFKSVPASIVVTSTLGVNNIGSCQLTHRVIPSSASLVNCLKLYSR